MVRFAVTYTKDVRKKRHKQWLDGELEVDVSTRSAKLFPECSPEQGGSGAATIARIDALPEDVSLQHGGGDAFVMCGGGDRGKEYLVQVDEASCGGKGGFPQDFAMPKQAVGLGLKKHNGASATMGVGRMPVQPKGMHQGQPQVETQAAWRPRQLQEPQEEHKRRKRSTQEVLDMLGIEVKGFKEANGVVKAPSPMENVDVNRAAAVIDSRKLQRGENLPERQAHASTHSRKMHAERPGARPVTPVMSSVPSSVPPARHASEWTNKPVDRVFKPSVSNKMQVRPSVQQPRFDGTALVCPTAQESIKPVRTIRIPTSFDTTWEYLTTMKKAVLEEAHLRIIESTTAAFFAERDEGRHSGKTMGKQVGKGRKKMPFDHGQCQLKMWRNNKGDDDSKSESVYLHLGPHRLAASEYHKSDVWLLSNEQGFGSGPIQKLTTWTCIVRSLWHGPNKDGKFEVEFVSERPRHMGNKCNVWALKGPDVSIELDLAEEVLEGALSDGKAPIISNLLSMVSADPLLQSAEELAWDMPAYNEVADRFRLNQHQRSAMRNIGLWHINPKTRPVCLVHGPFGTGKSQLMVAILHLIVKLRQTEGGLANSRVMVSSHTNIAVDRVCLGLVESGMTDFLRVGALRKIHVDLLGHSLHASESKAHASALSELKEMAKGAQGRLLAKIKLQIADVERGADRQRKKLLKTCPIVGVTCVSTSLDVLQGQAFDVLLLDEASQLTEPLSLAPAIRSNCKYLIAAGDPNQLPPVVCSPEHINGDRVSTLVRPMFVRLVGLGHEPHLLKTQYRCHPDISEVCNKFFYGNLLEDGVGHEQRQPLIPSMKHAVAVVDVQGQEQYRHRSVFNDGEARAVGILVRNLLQCGVAPNDIGVIAFYRAHVDALKRAVGAMCGGDSMEGDVQIATVDSFQGAEKQVIILSTATTKASSFASDACRLNVALSRAKHHLFLVTNQGLCRAVPCLDYIVRRSQAQGGYFLGGIPAF